MADRGLAQIDFGSAPGASHTTLAIAAPLIQSGSVVSAKLIRRATTDHSEDEHTLEGIEVSAGSVSAGVGFTIHARASGDAPVMTKTARPAALTSPRRYGAWFVEWEWR